MVLRGRIRERGGSKLNVIIPLLILAAMIFVIAKIVPVYLANYQFQDAIETEAKFALTGYPKKSLDDLRDDVYKKAQELDIPAQRESIRVAVDASRGYVDIGLDYAVPIDLRVYQFTLQFHPHADNHTI
jgi:YbbR domain-containing protein